MVRRSKRPRLKGQQQQQRPRFSCSEVERMEELITEKKEGALDESFCLELADEFNSASGRAGSNAIRGEEVREWFQNKLKEDAAALPSTSAANEAEEAPPANRSNAPEGKDVVDDNTELEFEAKSSRDGAWYDIATFIAHRMTASSEFEVLVRFQGYGSDEDEWVNVKAAVRDRSIPLESSECRNVSEGSPVLCFRENNQEALYFDGHVVSVQRKQHDIRGCRCVFLVRYDHDQTEERVSLRKLCRRPS